MYETANIFLPFRQFREVYYIIYCVIYYNIYCIIYCIIYYIVSKNCEYCSSTILFYLYISETWLFETFMEIKGNADKNEW